MRNKFRLLLLSIIVAISVVVTTPVSAAGSAIITVETSASTVTTNTNLELRFYVTPSGANVYSASIAVALSNLTYQSYDSAGTPFSFATVPTSSSTSFEIVTSYQGASTGGAGKQYMGKVIVLASGSPGTGQITLSSAQAYDAALDPMAASSQNKSVAISAPATPPPTCPSGQTGTPPNCTTPVVASTTHPANPIANPNPNSNATVPTATSTPEAPASEVVPETVLSETFDVGSKKAALETQNPVSNNKKPTSRIIYVLIGGAALIILAGLTVAARSLMVRRMRLKGLNSHFVPPTTTLTQPVAPDQTVTKPELPTEPPEDGPTVIYPQNKG